MAHHHQVRFSCPLSGRIPDIMVTTYCTVRRRPDLGRCGLLGGPHNQNQKAGEAQRQGNCRYYVDAPNKARKGLPVRDPDRDWILTLHGLRWLDISASRSALDC